MQNIFFIEIDELRESLTLLIFCLSFVNSNYIRDRICILGSIPTYRRLYLRIGAGFLDMKQIHVWKSLIVCQNQKPVVVTKINYSLVVRIWTFLLHPYFVFIQPNDLQIFEWINQLCPRAIQLYKYVSTVNGK